MKKLEINKPFARKSGAWVAKMAIMVALSFLLYYIGRFIKIPIFPSFLDFQISELPALFAGFSMGPVSGCLVIIIKCALKLPLSGTAFVGELTDMLLGVAFVLPASLLYRIIKSKKSALYGMLISTIFATGVALLINRYISVPFYINYYFGGKTEILVNALLVPIYPKATVENFWTWYLCAAVIPFNLLRYIVVSVITFLFYKRLSKILHWDGTSWRKKEENTDTETLDNLLDQNGDFYSKSEEDTALLALALSKVLQGNEKIILEGELGAGKTTFTKGLAKALGVEEEITSPTFTIMNQYLSGKFPIYHLDMYRIEKEEDIYELGIEDEIDNGITIIEWNKLESLTGKIFVVKIDVLDENNRKFNIKEQQNDVSSD